VRLLSAPATHESASAPRARPPALNIAGRSIEWNRTSTPSRARCRTRRESWSSSHLMKVTTSSMPANAAASTSLIRKRIKSCPAAPRPIGSAVQHHKDSLSIRRAA
jgi:hypothetical protein